MTRENKPPQELLDDCLYELYLVQFKHYHLLKAAGHSTRDIERMLETNAEEAGYRGTDTGLMSEEAYKLTIQCKKKGTRPRISKEHPITYRSITVYCFDRSKPLAKSTFIGAWEDLVTVETTPKENHDLKKLQEMYMFRGERTWQDIYALAGIKLMARPNYTGPRKAKTNNRRNK